MPLEDLTGPDAFTERLNREWPLGSDFPLEGDDHIRGIKNVILNTFGPLAAAFVDLAHTWKEKQTFNAVEFLEAPVFPNRVIPAGIFIGWSAATDPNYDYFRARICDGRTFGKAGSAADLEDAEMWALYERFWTEYDQKWIEVIGDRGADAVSDWDALKPMRLPDLRARAFIGSGQSPDSVEGDPDFGPGADRVLGEKGGTELHSQTAPEVGPHTHPDTRGVAASIMQPGSSPTLQSRNDSLENTPAGQAMDWMPPFFASPWAVTY